VAKILHGFDLEKWLFTYKCLQKVFVIKNGAHHQFITKHTLAVFKIQEITGEYSYPYNIQLGFEISA
jgi:hypothetical protein